MIEMYFLIDIYLIQICTEENRKIGRKPCMSMLQCYSATVSGLMSNNPGPLSQCPVLKMSKCHHPPNSHPTSQNTTTFHPQPTLLSIDKYYISDSVIHR